MNPIDRILAKCVEEGDCLIWTGATDGRSTPVMHVGGRNTQVRRVMLEDRLKRPIRKGYVAARACHNRMCVACVKEAQNRSIVAAQRGAFNSIAKDLSISLAKRKLSRYSDDKVRAVRDAEGSYASIAEKFGMSRAYVGDLKNNRRRKDYGNPFAGLGA